MTTDTVKVPAGTVLYHGTPAHSAEAVRRSGVLLGRSQRKSQGGTMDEGGLVWFTPYKDIAEWFAGDGGAVLEFELNEPLRLLKRHAEIPNQLVADALNEALGIPDYKAAQKGDGYNTIALRAYMSSPDHLFDSYETDGGTMKVIWPVILKELFADGLAYDYDRRKLPNQIAIPADELQVRVSNPRPRRLPLEQGYADVEDWVRLGISRMTTGVPGPWAHYEGQHVDIGPRLPGFTHNGVKVWFIGFNPSIDPSTWKEVRESKYNNNFHWYAQMGDEIVGSGIFSVMPKRRDKYDTKRVEGFPSVTFITAGLLKKARRRGVMGKLIEFIQKKLPHHMMLSGDELSRESEWGLQYSGWAIHPEKRAYYLPPLKMPNPRKFVTLDPNISYPLATHNITERGLTPKQAFTEASKILREEKKKLKRLESMPETSFRFGLEDRIHERMAEAKKQRAAAKRAM